MINKRISSRIFPIIRASVVACLIPAIFIYILLNKPDYKLMNAVRGIIVPATSAVSDVITWPIRAVGNIVRNVRQISIIREENRELRAQLDDALRDNNQCQVLAAENTRLLGILGMTRLVPQKTIIADVVQDLTVLYHSNFILSKGASAGIATGMAVISTDGFLVGIVSDVEKNESKVRALTDAKSNIPVRAAGTDVYGFLRGNGVGGAVFEFFSDPEFTPTVGIKLLSSGIRGNLPADIPIGTIKSVSKSKNANVDLGGHPARLAEIMVLSFDNLDKYK